MLKPRVSWESANCVCWEGKPLRGQPTEAPRDAGGLSSVFTRLNKQLYILIEAEEPLIGLGGVSGLTEGNSR